MTSFFVLITVGYMTLAIDFKIEAACVTFAKSHKNAECINRNTGETVK